MNTTPNANRKHIGIYGNTNSGKSSLMNKILNQDISLVSNGLPVVFIELKISIDSFSDIPSFSNICTT